MASRNYEQQDNEDDGDEHGDDREEDGQLESLSHAIATGSKFVINKASTFSDSVMFTLTVSDELLVAVAQIRYKPNQDGCEVLTCWCFATHGLQKYDAKEVCLLLECVPDEGAVNDDVFRYLLLLQDNIKRGRKPVTEGSFTRLVGGDSFLGQANIAGFVHVRRRPTQNVGNLILPSVPHLFLILVKTEELFLVEKKLTGRLLLKLGHQYDCYPFPLWCSRNRKPVYEGSHNSILIGHLTGHPVVRLPDVVTHSHAVTNSVTMYLPESCHLQFLETLDNWSTEGEDMEETVSFVTDISDVADGHMVYCQDDDDLHFISKLRQRTDTLGLTFLTVSVVESNSTSGGIAAEDGVILVISPNQFHEFHKAIRDKTDWRLEADLPLTLSIKWVNSPMNETKSQWTSPIDGKSMSTLRARARSITPEILYEGSVCLSNLIRISTTQEIQAAGLHMSQLAKLVKTIGNEVVLLLKPFWESSDLIGIKRIGLRVFARPGILHGIYSCGSQPGKLPTKCCQALRQCLLRVEFPKVQSSLAFELTFQVRDRNQD